MWLEKLQTKSSSSPTLKHILFNVPYQKVNHLRALGNVLSIFGINNVKKNAELYQVAIKSIAGSQTSKKYT